MSSRRGGRIVQCPDRSADDALWKPFGDQTWVESRWREVVFQYWANPTPERYRTVQEAESAMRAADLAALDHERMDRARAWRDRYPRSMGSLRNGIEPDHPSTKAAPVRRETAGGQAGSPAGGMFDGPDVLRWGGVEVGATRVRVGGAEGQTEELSPVERAVLRALMVEAASGKAGEPSDACVSHRSLQRQAGQLGVSGWNRELNIVVTRLRTRLRGMRALVRIESVPHVGYRIRDLKMGDLKTAGPEQAASSAGS